jgi:hypothetical protein
MNWDNDLEGPFPSGGNYFFRHPQGDLEYSFMILTLEMWQLHVEGNNDLGVLQPFINSNQCGVVYCSVEDWDLRRNDVLYRILMRLEFPCGYYKTDQNANWEDDQYVLAQTTAFKNLNFLAVAGVRCIVLVVYDPGKNVGDPSYIQVGPKGNAQFDPGYHYKYGLVVDDHPYRIPEFLASFDLPMIGVGNLYDRYYTRKSEEQVSRFLDGMVGGSINSITMIPSSRSETMTWGCGSNYFYVWVPIHMNGIGQISQNGDIKATRRYMPIGIAPQDQITWFMKELGALKFESEGLAFVDVCENENFSLDCTHISKLNKFAFDHALVQLQICPLLLDEYYFKQSVNALYYKTGLEYLKKFIGWKVDYMSKYIEDMFWQKDPWVSVFSDEPLLVETGLLFTDWLEIMSYNVPETFLYYSSGLLLLDYKSSGLNSYVKNKLLQGLSKTIQTSFTGKLFDILFFVMIQCIQDNTDGYMNEIDAFGISKLGIRPLSRYRYADITALQDHIFLDAYKCLYATTKFVWNFTKWTVHSQLSNTRIINNVVNVVGTAANTDYIISNVVQIPRWICIQPKTRNRESYKTTEKNMLSNLL